MTLKRAFALALLALLACNRHSDNGWRTSVSSALLPVAVAGEDFEVVVSTPGVALDGSASTDPAGGSLTYLWAQLAGTPVTLSNPAAVSPTFDAPAAPDTLTFQLTVTGASGTDTDTVEVAVKTLVVTAPDAWFVGYGASGSISAGVSGGTPPYTYEWTGMAPWLQAGGTATATLSYTTPSLGDFQAFPVLTDIGVLKRSAQGRLQLTVRVQDSLGASDEELVNFSAGPFAASVMGDNVPPGEPVLLNGGSREWGWGSTITWWNWTGTRPDGNAISFFRADKTALGGATTERFVYFVPDQVGRYQVILRQGPDDVAKVFDITCGRFSGIGGMSGEIPHPLRGECGSCHAGAFSWLSDLRTPWSQTAHAGAYARMIDPTAPYYGPSQAKQHWRDAFDFGSDFSIDQRTVGWSAIAASPNDGWVERATADRYAFKGTGWSELSRKHPRTAGLSNVQCESCHGPGSEHAGDSTRIRTSYDAALCGRCHDRNHDQWDISGHGSPTMRVKILGHEGTELCNGCHTAQGFVAEMRAQRGADPHAVLAAGANPARPVLPEDQWQRINCQACHDPHRKTPGRDEPGADPQLRAHGRVQFRDGTVVNAGEAAACFVCHQSQRDARSGSADSDARRSPHFSTAAEMLRAANGQHFPGWTYEGSPHGLDARFITPGRNENRQCLACHADAQPAPGASGYGALGGHTFNVVQGTGGVLADDGTHSGGYLTQPGGFSRPTFSVTSGPTFMRRINEGDWVTMNDGPLTGTYRIARVLAEYTVQLDILVFGGSSGAVSSWSIWHDPAASGSGNGATLAGTKTFTATSAAFLGKVFPGDTLSIATGADAGTYVVTSVDGGRHVTVQRATAFAGSAGVDWTVTSVKKYNVVACEQCHTVGAGLQVLARADYDGDGAIEVVQEEVAGLIRALKGAIDAKLPTLTAPGMTIPLKLAGTPYSARCNTCHPTDTYIRCTDGFNVWTFPGPAVPGSESPYAGWSTLTPAQQAEWTALYQAAYNLYFVVQDDSLGIHNTGYAVNLLRSSYKAVTGSDIGAPFVPYP